jgi:predicted Fe-Mo cluster-binding NifX family protein
MGFASPFNPMICDEMTKAAFATWNDRIAPVFDVARSIQLVETEAGQIVNQTQTSLTGEMPNLKVSRLAELEVGTLVCGAISRSLEAMLTAYGIQVIPFVAGNLQEVIQAWMGGKLAGSAVYAMPGCRRVNEPRFQGAYGKKRREDNMDDKKRGKRGAGQGPGSGGQGRKGQACAGQAQGRGGRTPGADPGFVATQGICVCPQCGHQQPHERGIPCMQKKCAQCGTVLTRQ